MAEIDLNQTFPNRNHPGNNHEAIATAITLSYDAGTEANSEMSGTIPGPADGGEGFNSARDDIADEIRGHAGVLTADDGLASSVLAENHCWDNPVARVTITRLQ